jgi:endonuclease/exonuclease/phosphatase (EEP) superfamily protein YafD
MPPKVRNSFFALRLRPWGLLSAVGALAVVGTLAGFGARWGWVFDLVVNFRVQYFTVLALLVIVFAAGRRYRSAALYGGMALLNLAVIVPQYVGSTAVVASANAVHVRVALLNVHTENRRFDLVCDFVRQAKPDCVVFEEVNDEWLGKLAKLVDLYPHILPAPRPDNFGIALFSRWPLRDTDIREIGDADIPTVLARIDIQGRVLSLVGTHPLPPSNPEQFVLRSRQLSALAHLAQTSAKPCVVLGDLNTTPWSPYYRALLSDGDLLDVSRGRGLNASWPVPILPLRIPIDHCLISRGIAVTDVKLGPNVGSDHFPLIVDFSF